MKPYLIPARRRAILATLAILAAAANPLRADDAPPPEMRHHPMAGHDHAAMTALDGRELVFFPPEMRTHQLRNMRDHLQTVDGILRALATADYQGAARLAEDRLGMDSPSAAGCKPRGADAPAPAKGSMDEMMEIYMPERMRSIGLAMHTAAGEFAATARSGDAKAALGALGRVTELCVTCHSAYRTQ